MVNKSPLPYIILPSKDRLNFFRMIVFSSEGITMNSVIGLEDTNRLVPGGIEKETESVFQNARKVLERNGSSLDQGNEFANF